MTILVLGGTGKTGSRLTSLLIEAKVATLVASRSGTAPAGAKGVKFDWTDEATYGAPFAADADIKAVYLVPPPFLDVFAAMKKFVDLARSKGVERFVLLGASNIEPGGPATGEVHQYLIDLGVDYTVLRPTWFLENFSEMWHLTTIREEGKLYSATGTGKIPFVSSDDIAALAYHGLVDTPSPNTDWLVHGPDNLSYDDVAAELTTLLGRDIKHESLSVPAFSALLQSAGFPADLADMLAGLDGLVADGWVHEYDGTTERVTGRKPTTFKDFLEANKAVWT
ncbi:MAG: hypothetical protein M1832_003892 [Thelocarpon impressellum]|nr:MAG: hypothetical protein M1832_003892 [Thelocarpon impressellum]